MLKGGEYLNIVVELNVDRVDLVGEGANTAAFIKLAKGKVENKMNLEQILTAIAPEHSAVIKSHIDTLESNITKSATDLTTANATVATKTAELATAEAALAKAKADLEKVEADLVIAKKAPAKAPTSDDDLDAVIKGLPENMQGVLSGIIAKQKAAEAIAADLIAKQKDAEALVLVSKMKSIPVEESVLTAVVKSADKDTLDVLMKSAEAIEKGMLTPVGKSTPNTSFAGGTAWAAITKAAKVITDADSTISNDSAIAKAITANPDLYNAYLKEVNNNA